MPNAKDAGGSTFQRILAVGRGAAGKTSQIWTLPGRKFAYIFDPAALSSLAGCDIDYELFLPDAAALDATLKGFNKNAKDDKPSKSKEPLTYMRWVEDLNKRHESGELESYDWLIIDSLSLLVTAVMDRNMYLNNRYGGIEDLSDYRVVGSKMTEVLRSIFSLNMHVYCTGHLNSFQDDKTKKIETQINLPGKARTLLPLLCSNIWELRSTAEDKGEHVLLTKPEPRGFTDIRSSIQGLKPIENVEIKDFRNAQNFGIGALLKKSGITLKPAVTSTPAAKPSVETSSN